MWVLPGYLIAQPDTLWSKAFGGLGGHTFYSVKQTHDNGFIAVGGTRNYWLVKTDSEGKLIWEKTFGGGNAGTFRDVEQTADSGYIIIGYSIDPDFYVARTDSLGNLIWEKTYGGAFFDFGNAVLVLDDGGFLFAGFSNSFDDNGQARLIRTDSNGDTLWTRRYGGGAWDNLTEIKKLNDGGYIITGLTHSIGSGLADFWLMKLDSAFDVVWETAFGGPETDIARDVIEASDGGFVMTGKTASFGAGDDDLWIVKTNSEGDSLWAKTFGAHRRDRGFSIIEASTGGYLATGSTGYFNGGLLGRLIIRTDENGYTLWTAVTEFQGGVGLSIINTLNDWFVVAGSYFFGSGHQEGILAKIIVRPYAFISTDSTWIDDDLDGYAEGTLDGSESYNAEGYEVISYEWSLNGEIIGTNSVISYILPTGTHTITLSVTDETGISGSKEVEIDVYHNRLPLNSPASNAVTSIGDSIFFTYTEENVIYKYDRNAEILWSVSVGSSIQSALTIGPDNTIYAATKDSGLYAINLDGEILFHVPTEGIYNVSPAVGPDGTVYIGTLSRNFYAFNGSDGSLKWVIDIGIPAVSSPAISRSGTIYVNGGGNSLFALNPDGSVAWKFRTGGRLQYTPALDSDGNVYFSNNDDSLYAVSPSGELIWSTPLGGIVLGSPVIAADGTIYVESIDASVYALSSTGEILWSYKTDQPLRGTPALLTGSRVCFGTLDGELFVLDSNGDVELLFKMEGAATAPPLVTSDGIIHIGSDDGNVYILADPYFIPDLASGQWPTFQGNNRRTGYQGTLVSVRDDKAEILPTEYSLKQNYPNPFNPVTLIEYELPLKSHVLLTVYNLNGQEIARLTDEIKPAGRYQTEFDASRFSSGIYIYRIQAKNYSKARKMLLLK